MNATLNFRALTAPALVAFKTYWPAILLIQLAALALVVVYYTWERSVTVFTRVAEWKEQGGLLFAAVTTVFSGGILPESLKRLIRPRGVASPGLPELLHQFGMWAILGCLIDLFYRLQAEMFGHGSDPLTLLCKVLADQFVFTPLVSLPFIVLWTKWFEVRYRPRAYAESLNISELIRRALPLWATCLIFWPSMLLIVYSLPQMLQFPLFLLGNSAFSILMIFILRRQAAEQPSTSISN